MSFEALRPTYTLAGVEDFTPSFAAQARITTAIFDVDGTLSDYHALELEPAVHDLLHNLSEAGLRLYVASNAYGHRVDQLRDEVFAGVIAPDDIIAPEFVVGGGDARAARKPSPAMINYVIERDTPDVSGVVMVGDQLFKDVFAANRAGVRSVLVPRRGEGDHMGVRLVQRPVEALARGALRISLP